jgi:DNA topoisomerase-2
VVVLISSPRSYVPISFLVIGMAQDFVGSNNLNLLIPSGQFGTRLAGGEDAASPRYIFTQLSPVARYLYPEIDDMLLTYLEDDGQNIEPKYFCPIIPMLLVNGTQGIGTGWSTFVPPYNPEEVLNYIRAKLDDSPELPTLCPWSRGFDGRIEPSVDGKGFVSYGHIERKTKSTVVINELPLGTWTNAYKTLLVKMRDHGEIDEVREDHTTTKVKFTVTLKMATLNRMEKTGLERVFKLSKSLPTTNMHAFDGACQIKKFENAESIADEFFPVRLRLYQDRKSVLQSEMNHAAATFRNKARFIEAVTSGEIELVSGQKSKMETVAQLVSLGYTSSNDLKAIRNDNDVWRRNRKGIENIVIDEDEVPDTPSLGEYDYLLNMPLSSLTAEKIQDLRSEANKKDEEQANIKATTAEDLWREDLDRLEAYL